MATIPGGIPFAGLVAPTDDTDVYAVTDETYNRGGYRSVADIAARDAITAGRRLEGMLVCTLDTGKMWKLSGGITNGDWVEYAPSGTDYSTDIEYLSGEIDQLQEDIVTLSGLIPEAGEDYSGDILYLSGEIDKTQEDIITLSGMIPEPCVDYSDDILILSGGIENNAEDIIIVSGLIPDLTNYLQSGNNISELVNDSEYITSGSLPDLTDYIESGDNISELVNDSEYITSGSLPDLDDYALVEDLVELSGEIDQLQEDILTLSGLLPEPGEDYSEEIEYLSGEIDQIQEDLITLSGLIPEEGEDCSADILILSGEIDDLQEDVVSLSGEIDDNFRYIQNSLGVSLNYWLETSRVLQPTYVGTPAFLTQTPTQEAEQELTAIYFRSSVAQLPAPFVIKNGTEFLVHFNAKVTATAGKKDAKLRCKLFYCDADGVSNLVQIGAATSDSILALTGTAVLQELYGIVTNEVSIPAGKRLFLKFYSVCSGGAANYPEICVEYGDVHDHLTIPATGGVVGNNISNSLLLEKGDIIYASDADTPARLVHGFKGQHLSTGGHNAVPSWEWLFQEGTPGDDTSYTGLANDGYNFIYLEPVNNNVTYYLPESGGTGHGRLIIVVNSTGTHKANVSPRLVDSTTRTNEALDASETGVDVVDGTKVAANNVIKVENEDMYVVSILTNTLTVIRGYNSTTAASHNTSIPIYKKGETINGYYSDVEITEKLGWWAFYDSAELNAWVGITDGNSTIYQTSSPAPVNLSTTSGTWADVLTLANIPPGIYDLEGFFCHYCLDSGINQYDTLYAGIGTVTGNAASDIVTIVQEIDVLANHLYEIILTQNPKKYKYAIAATDTLYLKGAQVSDESPVNTHSAYSGDATYPIFLRARRVG